MDLLLESFERNGRVNEQVLNALTSADLSLSDGLGGYSIGKHLGHLCEFRYGWLSSISPEHAEPIPSVVVETDKGFELSTREIADLAQALRIGDEQAVKAVSSALREGRSFEKYYVSHPGAFLQHTIVHDSHHRGQIMSLLRQGGRTMVQMDLLESTTWPIWRG